MKPAPFRYHDPSTLPEALSLLASLENAKALAGGQSLGPMLNMRFVTPDHLIDLNGVPELTGLVDHGDELHIGAMTRQRELEFSPIVAERCPLMAEAIKLIGHRQTRNRGTIGGSLCHLDPAAELVCVCAAMDAMLDIAGPDGARELAFADFPLAYMTPAVEPQEILAQIRLPLWPPATGFAFVEFSRRRGDFAIVSAAALLLLGSDGRIVRVALALGGVNVAPQRMHEVEDALIGALPSAEILAQASEACRSVDALGDPYASENYRKSLAVTMSRRALALAAQRAQARAAG
jgi:aerobic carbon-monoxide dehydrogenase medium subunit